MSAPDIEWRTQHGDRVEVYRTAMDKHEDCSHWCRGVTFRYRVVARNNRVVETGSEGYQRRRDAVRAALRHHPLVEVAS